MWICTIVVGFECNLTQFFIALQLYSRGIVASTCLSVRPSVCLSAKRVRCDKTKATSANILIPHARLIGQWLCKKIQLIAKS